MNSRLRESCEVDHWQWQQMLLTEYGPSIESHRIVALVISMHMSKDRQEAWPSQETIARRAQLSLRQTRRFIEALEREGWICRAHKKRDGQRWRLTSYHPAVPLLLSSVVREHAWETDTNRADTQMSSPMSSPSGNAADIKTSARSREGADTQMSAVSSDNGKVRTFADDVRTSDAKGADISPHKVRTFSVDVRTSGCPTKSSSEALKSPRKTPSEGAARGGAFVIDEA